MSTNLGCSCVARAEIERRLRSSQVAEGLLEKGYVGTLVAGDDLCELSDFAAQTTRFDGLRVEGGLEILEQEAKLKIF